MSRRDNWQGMNWCNPVTRLAIYLRDDLTCVWCQAKAAEDVKLSLDHRRPHVRGGDNSPGNLMTACITCNSARGDKPIRVFSLIIAERTGQTRLDIAKRILRQIRRRPRRKLAREILSQADSLKAALDQIIKDQ